MSQSSDSEDGDVCYSPLYGTLTTDTKSRLLCCLDRVGSTESFATFADIPQAANPGIAIDGIGIVGLPLSERDAQAIVTKSHRAPFGKGSTTVVDTAIRKTWELNTDQFKLENPIWQKTVEGITQRVAKELGVRTGIQAILYKMLLYEEGAMFKPHKDSEKAPGMFGTLVICLPSRHEGGQVRLIHGSKEMLLDTAKSSRFGSSYLAWYSDVTHEILPVTRGYRLVLTYNLVHLDSGTKPLAPDSDSVKTELQDIIALWKSNHDGRNSCPKALACNLDHKYTDASLQFKHLKGSDQVRLEYLQEICGRNGFSVFLANVELTCFGECYEQAKGWMELYFDAMNGTAPEIHDIEVSEESIRSTVIVDLDGTTILTNVPLDDDIFVQAEPFDQDPDEEDWSGPTGNEGVSATHFYRITVAILIPTDHYFDFFFETCEKSADCLQFSMRHWLRYLFQKSSNHSDKDCQADLVRLCSLIVGDQTREGANAENFLYRRQNASSQLLGMVVTVSLWLRDLTMLGNALSAVTTRLPSETYVEIGEAIHLFDFQHMHKASGMSKDFSQRDLIAVENWAREKTEYSLGTTNVCQTDGPSFVKVISKYSDTPCLFQKVLSMLQRNAGNTSFVIAFTAHLFDASQKETIASNMVIDAFHKILSGWIPVFVLEITPEDTVRKSNYGSRCSLVTANSLATLLGHCMVLGLTSEVDQILDKLIHIAERPSIFPICLLDCLGHLCSILPECHRIENTQLGQFARSILNLCATRYIGVKPTRDLDWARIARGCGCHDCQLLDSFLLDHDRASDSFALTDYSGAAHLEHLLPTNSWERDDTGEEYEAKKINEDGDGVKLKVSKKKMELCTLQERWRHRRDRAKNLVGEMDKEGRLRRLLGEGYDELVGKFARE